MMKSFTWCNINSVCWINCKSWYEIFTLYYLWHILKKKYRQKKQIMLYTLSATRRRLFFKSFRTFWLVSIKICSINLIQKKLIIISFLTGCQGRQNSAGEEVPDQVSQAPSGSDHPDPGLIPPDDRNPTDMQHGSKQHVLCSSIQV